MSGMNHPSINGSHGMSATWDRVWEIADESDAVESYDADAKSIKWVGEKEPETFRNPNDAINAIRVMSAA